MFAIRKYHEVRGLGNPLQHMPRVWLAVNGLKKVRGATARKLPVTARMLRSIRARLDLSKPEDAVRWSAITTAWYFLLRC